VVGNLCRRSGSLLAALLIGVSLAALPATAAAPSAPSYECTTNAEPTDPATATKIMIAGDSITNASAGDYTWPYWLYQNIRSANVDFVGSFQDTITANTLVQGSRAYLDCDFDQDHEARPGVKLGSNDPQKYAFGSPAKANLGPYVPYYPAAAATSWIKGAVLDHAPELMVLFAGNNDLGNTNGEGLSDTTPNGIATNTINNLQHVISEARAANPNIDIVLTTAPAASSSDRFGLYNSKLMALAAGDNNPNSELVVANLPRWVAEGDTWDGLHPDARGEAKLASVITHALHLLKPSLPDSPTNPQTPALGPRFPAQLSVEPDGDNRVTLTWTLPPGADRTVIYYRKTGQTSWVKKDDLVKASLRDYYPNEGTATCAVVCTSYTFTQLSGGGASYDFMVMLGKGRSIAVDKGSNVVPVTVLGPAILGKTTILPTTVGVHSATVRWNPVEGATGYEVRYRVAGSGTYVTTPSTTTPKVIGNLVAGRKYGFQVRARTSGSIGAWSGEVTGVPKANALGAGKKPVLAKVKGLKIKATWSASAGASKYQLQRRVVGGSWKVVATTTSRKVTSGKLKKGKTYEFRVRPYDGDVAGPYSPTKRRKVT